MVRAKVRCNGKTDSRVEFTTVFEPPDSRDTENQRFTKATPWGNMVMGIDNPAAMEVLPRGANRLLPITPNICLLVQFHIGRSPPLSDEEPELDLQRPPIGRLFRATVTTQQVKAINKTVARCAEDLVFTSQESAGVGELVRRNAKFGLDIDFTANVNEAENSLLAGYFVRIGEIDRPPQPSTLTPSQATL